MPTSAVTTRDATRVLFTPFDLAGLRLKNRLIMAPMGTCLDEGGHITEDTIAYYVRRAKGGVGTITVEGMLVSEETVGPEPKISGPQYLPGILPLGFPRLVIADLLASGTTDSNAIVYMVETVFTNAANTVAEGAAKPESALVFASVTEAVRKIAHWLPVTEEMLEDVAAIRSYIDARLRLGVQLKEEDQLMNGDGVAPNLLGILARPGLATSIARGAAETNADVIFRQVMTIYAASFLMPDGVVMNPADWATTVLTKSKDGSYLTAGPFAPIQSPTLWGLPVAVTPAIVAASALVGAFQSAAQVFRKGGIRVEASNSHQDFFIKNLVAIRAEERLALAVYRPGAFGKVTGLGLPVYP